MEILTMSDLRFLAQMLTLYRSLVVHSPDLQLTVLCMDDVSHAFLDTLALPNLRFVELAELERADPELAAVRHQRSWREYCWTAIPSFCHHALRHAPSGQFVFWLDADIELVRDPGGLADQLDNASVLLTPHHYNRAYPVAAPGWWLAATYGRFNGGSIAFRNNEEGMAAAALWRKRALAWCHDRAEPGRYGNQLYLDDFPRLFMRGRVLTVPGGILGPWNGGGFRVRAGPDGPTANGRPVFAYHYQSLRLRRASPRPAQRLAPNVFRLDEVRPPLEALTEPHYRLPMRDRHVFWRPYLRRLERAVSEVMQNEPLFLQALEPSPPRADVFDAIRQRANLESSRLVAPLIWSVRASRSRLLRERLPR
jgi:hypothetical protein